MSDVSDILKVMNEINEKLEGLKSGQDSIILDLKALNEKADKLIR
ncbi:hypothetical protein [Lentibacillus jeotgali]|nr:hypothetical protein [Lentibacillus jeotgali]